MTINIDSFTEFMFSMLELLGVPILDVFPEVNPMLRLQVRGLPQDDATPHWLRVIPHSNLREMWLRLYVFDWERGSRDLWIPLSPLRAFQLIEKQEGVPDSQITDSVEDFEIEEFPRLFRKVSGVSR